MAASLKMRRRVRFQRRAQVDDGAGNQVGEWADLCGPFWARLEPQTGKQQDEAQKLQGVQPYRVTVWHCKATAGVTADDKMIDDQGLHYDVIANVNVDEKKRQRSLLVVFGKATG